jgi:hypothetical protein
MSELENRFQQVSELCLMGEKRRARQIVIEVLTQEPENQLAWGWYVETSQNIPEQIAALQEYLKHFPNHQAAVKKLASLLQQQKKYADQAMRKDRIQIETLRDQVGQLAQANRELSANLTREKSHTERRKSPAPAVIPLVILVVMVICLGVWVLIQQGSRMALASKYNKLQGDYQSLTVNLNNLGQQYSILQNNYQSLSVAHSNLEQQYKSLMDIAVVPPYINTYDRYVYLAFYKLDDSLLYWKIPFEWLENHLERGYEARKNLSYDLVIYNSWTGKNMRVVDNRNYIDPQPFTTVISSLYYESKSEDNFIQEVWNIVAQLTNYATEDRETPRFPMETLLSGGGDCEDHAILFASMILAAPVNWEVELVYMDADHVLEPQTMNHVIVYLDTGTRQYWIEATSNTTMEPYQQGVDGWYFKVDRTQYK